MARKRVGSSAPAPVPNENAQSEAMLPTAETGTQLQGWFDWIPAKNANV